MILTRGVAAKTFSYYFQIFWSRDSFHAARWRPRVVCHIRLLQLSKQHRELREGCFSALFPNKDYTFNFFTLQPSAHPQRRRVTSDHRFIFFLLSPTLALRGDLCCLRLPTHIRELLCDFGACCSSSTMNNDFEQYFHHSCQPPRLATVEVFFGSWRVNRRFAANPTTRCYTRWQLIPNLSFWQRKGVLSCLWRAHERPCRGGALSGGAHSPQLTPGRPYSSSWSTMWLRRLSAIPAVRGPLAQADGWEQGRGRAVSVR